MSYEDKIDAAKAIIGDGPVFNGFLEKLKKAGGTSESALSLASYEDLEKMGLPILLAKQVTGLFRDKKEVTRRVITTSRADAMTHRELLELYDPIESDNPVGKALAFRAKGLRCIVFTATGLVNLKASEQLLNGIRNGDADRDLVNVEGSPTRVYKIGELPNRTFDENPLVRGEALRSDQTCSITEQSWEGIAHDIRVLLHLAAFRTNEINLIDQKTVIPQILDYVKLKSFNDLKARYPRGAILYDSLSDTGGLPTLKLSIPSSKPNDPFAGKNRL